MRALRFSVCLVGCALGILSAACADDGHVAEETRGFNSSIVGGQTETGHIAVALLQSEVLDANGTKTGVSTCTATLVTEDTLLTAAHCVVPTPGIRFGRTAAYFGTTSAQAKAEEIFFAKKTVSHPKYSHEVMGDFDVAIIQLDRKPPIPPVKVARSFGDLTGQTIVHVGWGVSISNGLDDKRGTGTKRSVELPIAQQQPNQLATGNGKSGICNGDSGGPAILKDKQVIVGVHSWGDDGAFCLKNGFSARVDRYVDFLSPFIGSAFVDLGDGGATPPPPPPAAGGAGGQCCINGDCFRCPSKPALDACTGFDLGACFNQCGQNAACLTECANQARNAKPNPSACTPVSGGNGNGNVPPPAAGNAGEDCSVSVQCINGDCRCGGSKAGAPCVGTAGQPNSCQVVCRVCN